MQVGSPSGCRSSTSSTVTLNKLRWSRRSSSVVNTATASRGKEQEQEAGKKGATMEDFVAPFSSGSTPRDQCTGRFRISARACNRVESAALFVMAALFSNDGAK